MRKRSTAIAALALLAPVCMAQAAAAQDDPQSRDEAYLAAKLMLGVAGDVDVNVTGPAGFTTPTFGTDAELSFGGGFAYMAPLHRYFVLGAQLALVSWKASGANLGDGDRNLMGDVAVVPQGRLPLTRSVELYLSVPLGISVDFLNQVGANFAGLASVDVDPALGFTVSVLAGARFAVSERFGVLTEVGYTLHSFSHDITFESAILNANGGDFDVDVAQLALNVGLYF